MNQRQNTSHVSVNQIISAGVSIGLRRKTIVLTAAESKLLSVGKNGYGVMSYNNCSTAKISDTHSMLYVGAFLLLFFRAAVN